MTGDTSMSYMQRGIIPRAVVDLYRMLQERPGTITTVRCSYLEIYNEQLYDLLAPVDETAPNLQIQDDASGHTIVRGLSMPVCNTEEEAMHYLFQGDTTRVIAQHQLNSASSRSHCIFTIHVEQRHNTAANEKVITSKLHLVDLAGSERVSKTHSDGKILQEANYINKSLTFLEQVVIALSTKNREHIPYRQSKLTNFLRDSLGGNCKTFMVANIHGEAAQLDETVSTLRFASRVMCVANDAHVNVAMDPVMQVRRLEREVRELKQELAMRDALQNRSGVTYGTLSDDQVYAIQQAVRGYLTGEVGSIDIVSVGQITETFRQFKLLAGSCTGSVMPAQTHPDAADSQPVENKPSSAAPSRPRTSGVGDVAAQSGFSIGIASMPAQASPVRAKLGATGTVERVFAAVPEDVEPAPPREDGFDMFCSGEGAELSAAVTENKTELARLKKGRRTGAERVNAAKAAIDAVTEQLTARQTIHSTDEDQAKGIVDQETVTLTETLQGHKTEYRAAYDELRSVTSEAKNVQVLMNRAKTQLLAEFDSWYTTRYPHAGQGGEDVGPEDETASAVQEMPTAFDAAKTSLVRNTLQMTMKRRVATRKRG